MSSQGGTTGPQRRRNHVEMPVAYAAVGASKAHDLLRFPPEGSTPFEEQLKLGSGADRFLTAGSLLMTWGAIRGAGAQTSEIEVSERPAYAGPTFGSDGTPQAAGAVEHHYGPEGELFLTAGTRLRVQDDTFGDRSMLVVFTVNEPDRVGFAWGTCHDDGAVGEQFFTVEMREDGTVWAVVRGFLTASKSGLLGRKAKAELRAGVEGAKRFIAALQPGVAIRVDTESATEDESAAETAVDPELAVAETVVTDAAGDDVAADDDSLVEAESVDAAEAGASAAESESEVEPVLEASDAAEAEVESVAEAEADAEAVDAADAGAGDEVGSVSDADAETRADAATGEVGEPRLSAFQRRPKRS